MQVWKWLWVCIVARRGGSAKGFKGRHGSDPGRNGGSKAFSEKRAERLILPRLDVAG
jgi:hypothetical protein